MTSGMQADARDGTMELSKCAEQPGELSDATTHDAPGSPAAPRGGLIERQGACADDLPARPAAHKAAYCDSWALPGQQYRPGDHLLPLVPRQCGEQVLPSGPSRGEWSTATLSDEWLLDGVAALPDAWDGLLPGAASTFTATPAPASQQPTHGERDEYVLDTPRPKRGGGRRVGRGAARHNNEESLREKNREAQRRFRYRQREKVGHLEEQLEELRSFRSQALAEEQCHREFQAALAKQLIALQADVSQLHAREVAIAELAAEVAALRASNGQGCRAALDELSLALADLQGGDGESAAQFCIAKQCLFVSPNDLNETDASLVLALRDAGCMAAEGVAPSQLKLRLRQHDGERVYSFAQLMLLPPQAFIGLHDSYAEELKLAMTRSRAHTEQLAAELHAVLCCFAAIHPQQSMLLQLREGAGPGVRSEDLNQRLLRKLSGVLHLSVAQLQRMREATLTFHRQQAHLQTERQGLLHAAAVPLGRFAGAGPAHILAVLDAEARLRRNLDLDLFNPCRLSAHFLPDVLTAQQLAQLVAASHPHPLNLMDLLHYLDAVLLATDRP